MFDSANSISQLDYSILLCIRLAPSAGRYLHLYRLLAKSIPSAVGQYERQHSLRGCNRCLSGPSRTENHRVRGRTQTLLLNYAWTAVLHIPDWFLCVF